MHGHTYYGVGPGWGSSLLTPKGPSCARAGRTFSLTSGAGASSLYFSGAQLLPPALSLERVGET